MSQKIEKCPFCGGECIRVAVSVYMKSLIIGLNNVMCGDDECGYSSCACPTEAKAISAHNQVSRNNAAAGELLETCKALLEQGESDWRCGDGYDGRDDLVELARASISKATVK